MPGKYAPLAAYLAAQSPETVRVTLTFAAVEALLGSPLPESAGERSWWGNRLAGRAQSRAWIDTGWRVVSLMLGQTEMVTFARADTTAAPA